MASTGGYGAGNSYSGGSTTGTTMPGTSAPSTASSPSHTGVATQTAKETVIVSRGTPGRTAVSPETLRRLSPEDRKALDAESTQDTTRSIQQLMDEAYHEDSKTMEGRQKNLVAAGLLDPSGFIPGVFDPPTAKAYQLLLTESAYSDSTPDEVQARRTKQLAAIGGPQATSKRAPLVLSYTDPRDIMAEADKAAPDLIGHGLSPAQAGDLVAAYHALESSYQHGAYNEAQKGGTAVTQPPSISAFLEQELQSRYPVDYTAMQIANLTGDLMKMIGGQGGPNG